MGCLYKPRRNHRYSYNNTRLPPFRTSECVRKTRVIVIGPPGSGKGTRARIIGKMYRIPVITAGDMLREVASKGTRWGKLAEDYMRRGELVPDDIVIGVMEERLKRLDIDDGFVLDGYPRSVRQAMALDRFLENKESIIDIVLNVVAKPDTIVERLSLRRSCPRCGSVYHLRDKPPREVGICDECGSELIQRYDDEEEIIRKRLEVYEKQTFPILEWYDKAGKVKEISGELEIDRIPEVLKRIIQDG